VNGSQEGDEMARKHGGAAVRPPLDQMTLDELRSWVRQTRAALQQKMQREQAYLARRAARSVRTPTDEAYEADEVLIPAQFLIALRRNRDFDSGFRALPVTHGKPGQDDGYTADNRPSCPLCEHIPGAGSAIGADVPRWLREPAPTAGRSPLH